MNSYSQTPAYSANRQYDTPARTNIFAQNNIKSYAVYDSLSGSNSSSTSPTSPNTGDGRSYGSPGSSISPQSNFNKNFSPQNPDLAANQSMPPGGRYLANPAYETPQTQPRNALGLYFGPDEPAQVSSDYAQNSPSPSPRVGRMPPPASPPRQQGFLPDIAPSTPLMDMTPVFRSEYQRGSEADITTSAAWQRSRGMTVNTAPNRPVAPPLKSSSSIPDLKSAVAQQLQANRESSSMLAAQPPMPWMESEGRGSMRSIRSAGTNASAMTYESSINEDARSSFNGSFVMLNKAQTNNAEKMQPITVEDAIDLYAELEIDDELERALDAGIRQVESYVLSRTTMMQNNGAATSTDPVPPIASQSLRNDPPPPPLPSALPPGLEPLAIKVAPPRPARSDVEPPPVTFQPPPLLMPVQRSMLDVETNPVDVSQPLVPTDQSGPIPTVPDVQDPLRANPVGLGPKNPPVRTYAPAVPVAVPRDIYGFKKESQYISETQYDTWNAEHSLYLERRYRKWEALMRQYGLPTDDPKRFPPKSDKIKRYVRKGLPPTWRGAAWFWYAGGPDILAREPGLYRSLVMRAENGQVNETDRDIIERDLHRTFPDNIRFKPDIESQPQHPEFPGRQVGPGFRDGPKETSILSALRRVLHAFAIHNPNIGYCQSLNFLAGLLLLFLNEDEEKAFILLNVLTNYHLPGIHAKLLEANVDVGVLMSCIQDSMPAIWEKIDDIEDQEQQTNRARARAPVGLRLPTVSLATTSWFMSCFLGNMPIESVLRVWDSLFYEGSKTLFRISLAIFKTSEAEIRGTREQLEIFQVVQGLPRRLLDINSLMEACFKRRNGFGHLSQELIDERRAWRRRLVRRERDEKDWEQLQKLQEKEARNPLGPSDSPAVTPLPAMRNPMERKAVPVAAPVTLLQTLPGQQQVRRKAPPIPPPPTGVMLGPVQPTSNPINLPLSPIYAPNPPIDQQTPPSSVNQSRPSTADQQSQPAPMLQMQPQLRTPQSQPLRGRAQYAVNPMVMPPTPTEDRGFGKAARVLRTRSRSRKASKRKDEWTNDYWMEAN